MSNKIMILWASLVVLVCATILMIGYNKQDKVYLKLERDLKKATSAYILDNDEVPETNTSTVVLIEDLIKNDYIKETKRIEKYCIKSVVFTKKIIMDKYEIVTECEHKLKSTE